MSDSALEVYTAIGGDRYLTPSEAGIGADRLARRAWDVYDRCFGRFTGAHLDPDLVRLLHGARRLTMPRAAPGSTVLVVGAAADYATEIAPLAARRDAFVVFATPGALPALAASGLVADLLLIEGVDARAVDVASLPRDTAILLARGATAPAGDNPVHVAAALPSWGLPLATAAALAVSGGAGTVVLAGAPRTPAAGAADRRDVALWALLDLLAAHAPGRLALANGHRPAAATTPTHWRRGWSPDEGPDAPRRPLEWTDHGPASVLVDQARSDLARLQPILADARAALQVALDARAAREPSRELLRAVERVLAWGSDPCLRASVQEGLGVAFLPRLWRSGISMDPAVRPWRPLVLALHELTEQADRLASALAQAGAAASRPAAHSPAAGRPASPSSKVTAVLPVLDDDVTGLRDAIVSLVKQTYRDVEVLVVHDAVSAASVADVLRDVGVSARTLESSGRSMEDLLDAALHAATGDLVAHHDLDGVSHPERLARQVAYLRRHPHIDVVAATTLHLDGGSGRVCDSRAHTPEALARLLPDACPFAHGSVLLRRDAVLAAGGYRVPASGASTYDHELWLRLLPTSRFAKLPTRLYARRGPQTTPTKGAIDGHRPGLPQTDTDGHRHV